MLKQVIEIYDLLDSAEISGKSVAKFLNEKGLDRIEVSEIKGDKG